jgi:hypothetical protein
MPNLSLCLLRDAIGGDDVDAVSRYLTLEMDDKWIDDISIVVQRFGPRNTQSTLAQNYNQSHGNMHCRTK